MPPVTSVVPSIPLSISTRSWEISFRVSTSSPLTSREIPLPPSADISMVEAETLSSQSRSWVAPVINSAIWALERVRPFSFNKI